MKYQFELLKQTRLNALNAIEALSLAQLNQIPNGFNNNIAWNFNHNVLVMHLLCYKISGLDFEIPTDLISKYAKGSKPDTDISAEEMVFFKTLALSSIEKLEQDYNNGIFQNYTVYPTSYNVTLNNIEEAISFNNVHEGLHFGYIMALKRAILS